MKHFKISLFLQIAFVFFLTGQTYTSYFTGNPTDLVVSPLGGVCLMGGAGEDDNAMKWFLQRANGGDILVLRTSGSNGYNSYLYSSLGINVNSVETIVFNSPAAAYDPYVKQRIDKAEAIWFAGGNQWNYISYWRNTPVDSAINKAIAQRNIVIGGISAGMAIQGKFYFTAQYGTIQSSTALSNPYHSSVTVDSAAFIKNPVLKNIITDTHFDNPDRKGRLLVFLARIWNDYATAADAIACDEYAAVCIEPNGIARVFGQHPTYDDNAYFIRVNCEIPNPAPEQCSSGNPLTWNQNGKAVKVCQIKGNTAGSNMFNLNTWQLSGSGTWLEWSAVNGNFNEQPGTSLNCSVTTIPHVFSSSDLKIYPVPALNSLMVEWNEDFSDVENNFFICDMSGNKIQSDFRRRDKQWYNSATDEWGNKIQEDYSNNKKIMEIVLDPLPPGIYFFICTDKHGTIHKAKIVKTDF
jgi:cyanophycinase-like exopeptidase